MEGTWHQMEYRQIAIPGSSNAQFSMRFNNVEIFTKESFETLTLAPRRSPYFQFKNSSQENSTPLEFSDISLYYGYNPYYENTFTNANGKIRNLVWEELI